MVALSLLQRRGRGPACVYRYFSLATRWGVVCPAPAGAVGGQRLRFGRYVTVPRLVPTTAPECRASLWVKPHAHRSALASDRITQIQDEQGGFRAGRSLRVYGVRTRREFL